MNMNFIAILVAALAALVIGFVWYGPLFSKAWMKEAGMSEEQVRSGNMLKIFGLSLLFAFFLAFMMQFSVIHQTGAFGMIGGNEADALPSYAAFMADYGSAFRTFKHGALHGAMMGLLFAMPVLATNALFERRSWKYIFINSGYWVVVLIVQGAIVCGWQ